MQGGFNNRSNFLVANSGNAPRAWGIFFQPRGTQRQEALTPKLDGWSGNIQRFGNVLATGRCQGLHSFQLYAEA